MKNTRAQKKGIWLAIIGLIFLLVAVFLYFIQDITDQGAITMGCTFIVLAVFWYFIKGKEKDISDELVNKIRITSMAMTYRLALLIGAVIYMISTWWIKITLPLDTVLAIFIFGSLVMIMLLRWRYGKHTEKLPF
ncbi:hypothetical protein AGMMS50249_6490 [candidate division SR1 bacterium]|nr:hypothetical protein AGMMS50249_6490 [candidate division SR1 bacterium]